MKNKIKFCLLSLVLLVACVSTPTIELDYKGLEDKGGDSVRFFTIYNRGNGDLKIEDFTSSCECSVIELKKNQIIKPKDSLIVSIKVNSNQDADNAVFITVKTNAKPRLTSFHFKP